MKNRIDVNWSKEELDHFLNDNYGYGLWEFENSFAIIFTLFAKNVEIKLIRYIEDRIKQLEAQKEKTIVSLDDFLEKANFYKLKKEYGQTKTQRWTPESRRKFIIENYKLNPFFSIIDEQIETIRNHREDLLNRDPDLARSHNRMNPINFLALVFSHSMKRGDQVDWINMEILFNWFSKLLKERNLLDFFGNKDGSSPSHTALRLTGIKYKDKRHGINAKMHFNFFFRIMKDEIKQNFPKPMEDIDKQIRLRVGDFDYGKIFIDVSLWVPFSHN